MYAFGVPPAFADNVSKLIPYKESPVPFTEAVLCGPGKVVREICEPSDGRAGEQVPARRLRPLLRRAHPEQGGARQPGRLRPLPQVDPRHGGGQHAVGAEGQHEVSKITSPTHVLSV